MNVSFPFSHFLNFLNLARQHGPSDRILGGQKKLLKSLKKAATKPAPAIKQGAAVSVSKIIQLPRTKVVASVGSAQISTEAHAKRLEQADVIEASEPVIPPVYRTAHTAEARPP